MEVGFVFDCRAITNPGRFDEYKFLTGLDRPVIEFIESGDEMKSFLDNAYALVSASVQRYLSRGFTDLSVAFWLYWGEASVGLRRSAHGGET